NASVFGDQLAEVKAIQGFAAQTARVFSEAKFWTLFNHNLQVLALMFLFCLIYGVGSVYLLLWNASVIGVVVGAKVKTVGFSGFLTGFLGLFPHGVFEVAAYFIASIAGGILSMAMVRAQRNKRELPMLALDVCVLAVVSIALLAVGAAVESSY
ncbi:MAG: stage II sporulation protein M, partial [Candidatus Norongarragalinales archaeon]